MEAPYCFKTEEEGDCSDQLKQVGIVFQYWPQCICEFILEKPEGERSRYCVYLRPELEDLMRLVEDFVPAVPTTEGFWDEYNKFRKQAVGSGLPWLED